MYALLLSSSTSCALSSSLTPFLPSRSSFFQSLCALGYCVAPLLLSSIISFFLHSLFVRVPVSLAAVAWAVWASVNFMSGVKLASARRLLAVYPLFLFYFICEWTRCGHAREKRC